MMAGGLIKGGLLLIVVVTLAGCATKGNYVSTNLSSDEQGRLEKGSLVKLQRILPDSPAEKLVLSPAMYTNGVYVCAIESLSKSCLPSLGRLVSDKLARKGIVIARDQSTADATLYFETWFSSFSTHASLVKSSDNPTVLGKDFAAKMEQSLATGKDADVHKPFTLAGDPISLIALNSNDDQKFVYVALTAVDMKDAIDFPGEGEKHVGASKNPWVKLGVVPSARTLIGNYDGEVPTPQAVTPMLNDAIDLLVERVGQVPKK
ncbi:MAG: hypothetical protein HY016_13580 [Nitrosomonadales bacterium]|nr:hypothetical protein [Nitrosomonadales bacterium]